MRHPGRRRSSAIHAGPGCYRLRQSLDAATTDLQELALRDPLAGLANRQLLDDRTSHAVARSSRDGAGVALLVINLDGFKPINEAFGHATGDAVLREVAARLQAQTRNHDTLARIGADEFALLLEGEAGETALAQVARRLLDALARPLSLGDAERPLPLSASIGIALHDRSAEPSQPLVSQAESAAQAVIELARWAMHAQALGENARLGFADSTFAEPGA